MALFSVILSLFLIVCMWAIRRYLVNTTVRSLGKAIGSQFKPSHPLNKPRGPVFAIVGVVLGVLVIFGAMAAYLAFIR